MKAVIKATKNAGSIQVSEVDVPKPEPDQVLVKIKAAGLCHTDITILENKYIGRKPVPIPLIMGHEGAGIITTLGSQVSGFSVGDRVALEAITGCGYCPHCQSGYINMCSDWNHLGLTGHGTFAEYITVSVKQVHKISDSIDFKEAALLEPLGLVVRSLEQSKPFIGETVCILGPGSLGLLHLLAFKTAGASKVIIVGLEQDKKRFKIANKLGADHTINISEQEPVKAILDFTNDNGADIVVETASSPKATELAFELAAARGRIVLFGLYPKASFSPLKVLRKSLTIYSDVGQVSRQFLQAIKWIETGKINVSGIITKSFSLGEAYQAFEAVKKPDMIKVIFEI